MTDKNLILMISDNGKGMDVNTLKELNARIQSNNVELDDREERNQRNTGMPFLIFIRESNFYLEKSMV